MAIFIKTRIQSRKAPQMSKLASMTQDEASKFGPYGKNDKPCFVDCYGKRTEWKSRRAATFFFTFAAKRCDGAESARYQRIVWELDEGKDVASDGQPIIHEINAPLPKNPVVKLATMKAKRDAIATVMDDLREKGLYDAAQRYADQWNDISLEIIRLTKSMRAAGLFGGGRPPPPLALNPKIWYTTRS